MLKAELVSRIDGIIHERRMTQVQAVALELSQLDVSRLLRGSFRDYSTERLLMALGRDVVSHHAPDRSAARNFIESEGRT